MSRKADCHPEKDHVAKGLCWACYSKARREANPGSRNSEYKSYYLRNKEREKTRKKTWREAHLEHIKEWGKIYREKIRDRKTAYMREYRSHPEHKLINNMRRRLHKALVNNSKGISAIRDLGCSIPAFKLYLENQFEDGMTWQNYGEWHLDHVIPISHFDLSDKSQLLEAFNWLNYQPMWAEDNLMKNNKIWFGSIPMKLSNLGGI